MMEVLDIPLKILQNLDTIWTFLLLATRYTAFFYVIPGIGEGLKGVVIRTPAILVFSLVSLHPDTMAAVPQDGIALLLAMISELLFGLFIGIIPLIIISGVQTGAQLASTSMGLGGSQLFDPTSGATVSDLARILGDLSIVLFLLINGHHVAIQAVSGFSGSVVAGSFSVSNITIGLITQSTANIFEMAVMLSAPVIVALLLTQFVMGLITKAVPTVNIFIVSFPLTIGIGLILSAVALPDMMRYVSRQITGIENTYLAVSQDTTRAP